jgi:hypothetical protein
LSWVAAARLPLVANGAGRDGQEFTWFLLESSEAKLGSDTVPVVGTATDFDPPRVRRVSRAV